MRTISPLFPFVIFVVLPSLGCAHLPPGEKDSRRPAGQTLFLALDGVPHELVLELKAEGRFREFQPPSKVIATFPSTSMSGFGGMFRPLGAERPSGYDRKYYSYEKGSLQGFILGAYDMTHPDYENWFDYYRKTPFQKFMMYLAPGFSGRRDLAAARRIIWRRPDQENYIVYIGGTDGAGHILGRKRLKRWLVFLDGYLKKIRRDYKREFQKDLQMVLFSDHGFHFQRPKGISRTGLWRRLRKAGLVFSNNLRKGNHVVSIEWGNISGASFHVREALVPEVARILAETRGVDIVAYRAGDRLFVLSSEGNGSGLEMAQILREGRRYCYLLLQGDPLHYRPVLAGLKSSKKLDRRGCAGEEDWFAATKDHEYPDAPYRLHEAFYSLVRNPAPILCSTEEDYEYGNFLTRVGAWLKGGLKGTHGGLFQAASAAFVMTTDPDVRLPSVLRYDQVMPYFFGTAITP